MQQNPKPANPFSRQYWRDKGLSEDEVEAKIKARTNKTSQTSKANGSMKGDKNPFSKAKAGDEGIKARISKSAASTKASGRMKGEKNPMSKVSMLAKGIDVRTKNHNCQEYWLKRGYSASEAQTLAKKSADRGSLSYHILKHGSEDGLRIFEERRARSRANWNPISASRGTSFKGSREARAFFRKLYKALRRINVQRASVHTASSSDHEYFVCDEGSIYFYDFVLHHERLIIEYNGVHVHPKPSMLSEEWNLWKHAYSKRSADEIAAYDKKKAEAASKCGYTVISVWSDDDKLVAIEQICERIIREDLAS